MNADEFGKELKVALSASRIWLDKFGESAKGSVSWDFACAFAEDYATQACQQLRQQNTQMMDLLRELSRAAKIAEPWIDDHDSYSGATRVLIRSLTEKADRLVEGL